MPWPAPWSRELLSDCDDSSDFGSNDRGRDASASMSGDGTMIWRSIEGFALASMISTGRSPPRYFATSVSGRCVAERPIRCGSGFPAAVTR